MLILKPKKLANTKMEPRILSGISAPGPSFNPLFASPQMRSKFLDSDNHFFRFSSSNRAEKPPPRNVQASNPTFEK
uniref:Uncharacterized protein n=1 Tax=Romanomermis culicivorax TaxID=13658 RepID=A0A915L090_ROMCU